MKGWALLLAASLASGAMLALSMPLGGWSLLGWICLVPLMLAVKGQGGLKGFVGGIAASLLAAWLTSTPLLGRELIADGSTAWYYVGFGLYGIMVAFLLLAVGEIKEHSWKTVLLLSCFAVILECLTFIKMPAHLALTQFASMPMLFLASITGIWGVSWLIWAANLVFLLPKEAPKRNWAVVAVAGLALLSQASTWSQFRSLDPRAILAGKLSTSGLVQTEQSGSEALLKLQEPLAAVKPDLAVWPELSVAWSDRAAIRDFSASKDGWPVIVTMLDDHSPKPHNAAFAYTNNGESEPYHKRKPFGAEADMVIAGSEAKVVKVHSMNVALNICFDSCYPWVMRDSVLKGAEVIALPTLDPKSSNGFIQAAHAAHTTFRAAELGVPIIRSEATAWSMFVGADGGIRGLAPVGWEGAMARGLDLEGRVTLYRLAGDWFLYLCFAVLAWTTASKLRHIGGETAGAIVSA